MTDPAGALAARIERFEQAADPGLIWDPAALTEAEQAMRACAGDRSDAATWRLIGILHLARYRLDQRTTQDAAVAGAFFAAVAVLDPERLPERLRGSKAPPGDSAGTWAGLVEEVFTHVDPAAYPHVGLLVHALVRRAMAHPTAEAADRLGRLLLEQPPESAWAPGALALLGGGLVRLYALTGEREVIEDAVHVLLRAALAGHGAGDLAAALGLAAPEDASLAKAHLAAAGSAPGGQDRSRALLALVDVARARSAASYEDGDLLTFIRVGQCALDFWPEGRAHAGVLAPYAAGLVEWYVVTGDERSLEAGREMLEALGAKPDGTVRRLGADPVVRLGLLGERRWRRYGVSGDPADLEIAVDVMREAAGLAAPGHPERARLLDDLANALFRRAVVTGGGPAEAIAAARAALAAHGEQDPARSKALLLLGQALQLDLTAEHADEAVAALLEALGAGERQAYGLVSEVLRWRATHVGGQREQDLNDAVRTARQGTDDPATGTPTQHGVEPGMGTPAQPGVEPGVGVPARRALGEALVARFRVLGDARDLGEALALAKDGDPELLARLGTVFDDPAPLPLDERLAAAATELALLSPDEDTALKLLRYAGRQATEPGEFLMEKGLNLAEQGRHRLAGSVLGRAFEAFEEAGRRSEAAYALSRQARAREELGEPDLALEAYTRSAGLYRALGAHRAEARQLAGMGRVRLRAGDPARAAEHYLRAVDLCAGAEPTGEEASYQASAADACLAAGDPATALACAVRARELYLALGDTQAAATVLSAAARAAVDQGDLTAAGDRITACALELEAAGAWEDACRALDAHAVLLAGRGHRERAAACEARLVDIVRRRGQRREPADEWYRIAQRRRGDGDAGGARSAFELAGLEYESSGHHDGAGSVRYNLGVLAYTEGTLDPAVAAFGAAVETFDRLGATAKEAAALTMRASCLTRLDRGDEAQADLDRALELAAASGDLDALFATMLHRAVLDVAVGEYHAAEERLYSALGPAAADPFKVAVVRDRLAELAARTGDVEARAEALTLAAAGFAAGGQGRLAALASVRLGFALEERGEYARARAALEEGLAGLESYPEVGAAPFEVMVAIVGGPDPAVLARLAAIQLTLGHLTPGRATLAQALDAGTPHARLHIETAGPGLGEAGAGRGPGDVWLRIETAGPDLGETEAGRGLGETWLRIEEAEAAGDLRTARSLAERALADDPASADRSLLLAKLSRHCRDLGDPAAAHDYATLGYELRDDRAVEHLRNLGMSAADLGRTDAAVRHLSRAAELGRDSDAALPAQLVLTLDALGRSLTDVGAWGAAAQAFDEALDLTTAPLWRLLRAPLLAHRAALHLRLGELNEAATAYRAAISTMEESGDRRHLATAYADLALIHTLHT
ncbi:hypothetical protein ITP53_50050, partial [Nonomuraea sp. K274]